MQRTLRWPSKVRIYFISLDGISSHESFYPYPGPDYRINNLPEPNNIFAKYSLTDARVWSLYLDETKGEDKNRVQLWKTRVDQVFVRILVPHFFSASSKNS